MLNTGNFQKWTMLQLKSDYYFAFPFYRFIHLFQLIDFAPFIYLPVQFIFSNIFIGAFFRAQFHDSWLFPSFVTLFFWYFLSQLTTSWSLVNCPLCMMNGCLSSSLCFGLFSRFFCTHNSVKLRTCSENGAGGRRGAGSSLIMTSTSNSLAQESNL